MRDRHVHIVTSVHEFMHKTAHTWTQITLDIQAINQGSIVQMLEAKAFLQDLSCPS